MTADRRAEVEKLRKDMGEARVVWGEARDCLLKKITEVSVENERLRAEVERLTKLNDIHLKTRDRVLGSELEGWSEKFASLRAENDRLLAALEAIAIERNTREGRIARAALAQEKPPLTHEYTADPYRPARCVNCGMRSDHAIHQPQEQEGQ